MRAPAGKLAGALLLLKKVKQKASTRKYKKVSLAIF